MPTRAKRLFILPPILAIAIAGCAGTRFYQSGLHAEEKGDAGTAYEKYCLAAGRDNSNGIIANGLVRTRDEAAAQSERAGLAAMDEGRYVDAWRHFMRTLDIQPDHATAPPLIRRLEKEYPFVIAAAKREWILRGSVALNVPKGPVFASATPTRQINARVEAPGESSAEAKPAPRKTKAPAKQPPKSIVIDSSIDGGIADDSAAPTRQINARVEAPGESSAEAKPVPRKKKAPAKQPPQPVAIDLPIDGEIADGADSMAQPSDSFPMPPVYQGGFISMHTLSLKDRRFPRGVLAADGIRIQLKDTDSDGQVDLDVFNGDKRIKKVRALELGRSQSFQGKTGDLYRLTLLSVNHKSRTVKFGVKRA